MNKQTLNGLLICQYTEKDQLLLMNKRKKMGKNSIKDTSFSDLFFGRFGG